MKFQVFLSKAAANPRGVFLVDGIGALSTAFLIGIFLPRFSTYFAVPYEISSSLALVACGFAVYSLFCSALNVKQWQVLLRIIAIANAVYCIITFGVIVLLFKQLTVFDVAYFLGEIGIIAALVGIELLTIRHSYQNSSRFVKKSEF